MGMLEDAQPHLPTSSLVMLTTFHQKYNQQQKQSSVLKRHACACNAQDFGVKIRLYSGCNILRTYMTSRLKGSLWGAHHFSVTHNLQQEACCHFYNRVYAPELFLVVNIQANVYLQLICMHNKDALISHYKNGRQLFEFRNYGKVNIFNRPVMQYYLSHLPKNVIFLKIQITRSAFLLKI